MGRQKFSQIVKVKSRIITNDDRTTVLLKPVRPVGGESAFLRMLLMLPPPFKRCTITRYFNI